MNERIRKLRREFNLTQQEFADRLNIKRNTVATYETGKSNPSDAAVNLICRTFNVNEEWLRAGKGEMLIPPPSNTLDALAAEFSLSEFGRTVIEKMVRLDDRQWEVISELVTSIVADISAKENEPPAAEQNQLPELVGNPAAPEPDDEEDEYDPELEAEVAEFRRQRRFEKSTGTSGASTQARAG